VAHAEPNIPRDSIPVDIRQEVREQIERLYSENLNEQIAAIRNLGNMGDKALPAVPFLEGLLRYPRGLGGKGLTPFKEAAHVLIRLGKPPIDRLSEVLADEDQNDSDRLGAVQFLGWTRDPRAVKPLIGALKDEKEMLRSEAAYTLGQMGDDRAISPLIATLDDESSHVRCRTAEALEQLGMRNRSVVAPLVAALENPSWRVRSGAALALSWMNAEPAKAKLRVALEDESMPVRNAAALALALMGESDVIRPLIEALGDEIALVRAEVAFALGYTGDPRAVEPLITALKDQDDVVRLAAVRALGKIGDGRALNPLTAILKYEGGSIKYSAAIALGQLKDSRAVGPLVTALKSRDPNLRKSAAQALGNRDSPVRWHVAFALRRMIGEDFGLDRSKWHKWLTRGTPQGEGTHMIFTDFFVFSLCTVLLPIGAVLVWRLLRCCGRRPGPGLSGAQRGLALCCLAYVITVLLCAVAIANTDRPIPFLHRNPVCPMLFRFSLAYLAGIPVVLVFQTEKEGDLKPAQPNRKRRAAKISLGVATLIALCVSAYMSYFHVLFGYVPSVVINPWHVIVPLTLAILVHLLLSLSSLAEYSRRHRILFLVGFPLALIMTLWLVTWPVNLCGPGEYYWLDSYLSSKYGVEKGLTHGFLDGSDAPVVVNEQPAPFGLVLRYFVFGERAVDHSAIFD
jgi:HEAT repeat protein